MNKYHHYLTKLYAIKWIGNEGSHSNEISKEDLIDAYDILNLVLHDLYETETERVNRLSKEIIIKKKANRDNNLKNEN